MTGLSAEMAAFMCGTVGGSGGTITGLIAERLPIIWGTVGGSGGTMTGLATAKPVLITRKAIRTATRAFNAFKVMVIHLLGVRTLYQKSNPNRSEEHTSELQSPMY